MALVDIPAHVLADLDPPSTTTRVRAFHHRTYQIVEPIDFPRELFADALAEHARLLEAHAAEILSAPVDHPAMPIDDRFVDLEQIHRFSTLLVGDHGAHEVHRWRTVDLSYVVQRCRGVVRRLMEMPPDGHGYVVVVAGKVASLQLVRGVAPTRAGDAAQLEVVERDLVVEPWEQWHQRDGRFVTTWWRTPPGDLVASRVPAHPWPKNAGRVVDALLAIRGPSVRARVHAHLRERPRGKVLAVVDTSLLGEELDVIDRRVAADWLQPFPEIAAALQVPREGLIPVMVDAYAWAALCWMPREPTGDLGVPAPLIVKRTPTPRDDEDDDDEEKAAHAQAGARAEPPLHFTPREIFAAHFDHFSPVEPWSPPARDVHAAWKLGLSFAAAMLLLLTLTVVIIVDPRRDAVGVVASVLAAVLTLGAAILGAPVLRDVVRDIDPARRERRWRAWTRVNEDLEAVKPNPNPKPKVEGRKQRMKRLARRLARLERLVAIEGPELVIENERKLVREAIAQLDASDADAVLAAWPLGASHLEAGDGAQRRKDGADKPN